MSDNASKAAAIINKHYHPCCTVKHF